MASKYSDKPICGPYAVAVISEREVEDVLDSFRTKFNKTAAWKGVSTVNQCIKILKNYGYTVNRIRPASGSLRSWVNKHSRPRGTYFVRVGGHFLAVVKGCVHDLIQVAAPEHHWAYRKRITNVFEISC